MEAVGCNGHSLALFTNFQHGAPFGCRPSLFQAVRVHSCRTPFRYCKSDTVHSSGSATSTTPKTTRVCVSLYQGGEKEAVAILHRFLPSLSHKTSLIKSAKKTKSLLVFMRSSFITDDRSASEAKCLDWREVLDPYRLNRPIDCSMDEAERNLFLRHLEQ